MKIAIEAQRIFRKNKHGMDFVALEVIRHLQKSDLINQYYILVAPGEDICLHSSDNMQVIEVHCPTYVLWEQIALPRTLRKIKPDLLHCTSNTAPLFCNIPLILTLHDIIFLEKRPSGNKSIYQNIGWYYRRIVVPRILPTCRKIITVSHFECKRITEFLHLDPERIVAIYNGYGSHFKPIPDYKEVIKKYITQENYLFFLGNTDPKKNTVRTLKAYQIYTQQSLHPLPLLIADLEETFVLPLIKEHHLESIKSFLIFPGYIANSDLPAIYSGAEVFLYTSLRESFGIPILEAMACGTPVITSNTSSMPEVAGEGAILADPFNEQEMAEKLIHLENDRIFYEQQVAYGLERVKLFSWDNTAKSTLEIYLSEYR
ncbi:MAG: glycosyltransferase family 1 protein, partial [Bacteroidales bacterium]|nr:glycosyltransferase family 1 protein [Bacteroidales bacterium]